MLFLDIVTILCIAPLVGVEFAVSAFVNPILWQLDAGPRTQATGLFARKLGTAMPFWYGAAFVLLVAETVTRRQQAGFLFLVVAAVLWAGAIAISILFLVPINNRVAVADASAPHDSSLREHRKWDTLHRFRIGILVVAMISFLAALRF